VPRASPLVYRLTYNGDVVAFKMGRRQGGPSRTGLRRADDQGSIRKTGQTLVPSTTTTTHTTVTPSYWSCWYDERRPRKSCYAAFLLGILRRARAIKRCPAQNTGRDV